MIASALLAGLLLGFGGGWKVQAWRRDASELQQQQKAALDARRAAAQVDRAAEAFQERQNAARSHDETSQKEVIRVVTKIQYRAECLDADGMRILSSDIADANSRRRAAPAVSGASASR